MKLLRFFFLLYGLLFFVSQVCLAQADICREAVELSVNTDCFPRTGGTFSFIDQSQDNSCGGDTDDDAWFKFTAVSPFTRVALSTDQVNDMAVAIFENDCATEIACKDDKGNGGQEIITIETTEGVEYFVQLYSVRESWGPFLICFTSFLEDPDKKVYCDLDLSFETTITPSSCLDSIAGSILLSNIEGGTPPYSFQLGQLTYQSDNLLSNLNGGTFNIGIIDSDSCRLDTSFTVPTIQTSDLSFSLGEDIIVEQGKEIRLSPSSNVEAFQTSDIEWSIPTVQDCPNPCFSPTFLADVSTPINASLMTIGNCEVSARLFLTVIPKLDIYLPTAFSPNADGINDQFMVQAGAGIQQVKSFQIYNHWGNLLFKQTDFPPNIPAYGWNGTYQSLPLSAGLYVYFMELELPDGSPQLFSGEVLLVR